MHLHLNSPFDGAHFHHFRFEAVPELGIYIPCELHNSITHSRYSGKGMREINKASLLWLCEQSVIIPEYCRALDDGRRTPAGMVRIRPLIPKALYDELGVKKSIDIENAVIKGLRMYLDNLQKSKPDNTGPEE